MITVRFYRALMWFGIHVLAKTGWTDRWGFLLGYDLDEWALCRMFIYLDRLQTASHLTPVGVTTEPPRPFVGNTATGGTTITLTRTFP